MSIKNYSQTLKKSILRENIREKKKWSNFYNKENKKPKSRNDELIKENVIELIAGLSYFILDSIKSIYFIAANIDINLIAIFFLNSGYFYYFNY